MRVFQHYGAGRQRPVGAGNPTAANFGGQALNTYAPRYFFSLGLNCFIFPLSPHYLRELYAASNPGFVAALGRLRFDQSLVDFDRKTGLFRVTTIYRQATGR